MAKKLEERQRERPFRPSSPQALQIAFFAILSSPLISPFTPNLKQNPKHKMKMKMWGLNTRFSSTFSARNRYEEGGIIATKIWCSCCPRKVKEVKEEKLVFYTIFLWSLKLQTENTQDKYLGFISNPCIYFMFKNKTNINVFCY